MEVTNVEIVLFGMACGAALGIIVYKYITRKKMNRLVLLICALLCACGPQAKLRRADRLVREAIAAGAIVRSDTVRITDTLIVKGPETTLFIPGPVKIRDTTIVQDRIQIRWKTTRDTVRMEIKCPTDTIKIEVPTVINRTIYAQNAWKPIALGLVAALFVLLLVLVAIIRPRPRG